MDDLTARALDTATARGAQYADVRLVRQERQLVLVRNGTGSRSAWARTPGSVCGRWWTGPGASPLPTAPTRERRTRWPRRRWASLSPAPACTGARWCWGSRYAVAVVDLVTLVETYVG